MPGCIMDTTKNPVPFNNFLTIVAIFVSNGLQCGLRSTKMNLIEKENILHAKMNKIGLGQKR